MSRIGHNNKDLKMKIVMDAVVNEFVLSELEREAKGKSIVIRKRDFGRFAIVALKAMLETELVQHKFNSLLSAHEFRSSDALKQKWFRKFPEVAAVVEPSETITIEIRSPIETFE
jgi:hypothetical protein